MTNIYDYMSADEIADFIVNRHNDKHPQFNMVESFQIGRLTTIMDTFVAAEIEEYKNMPFYRLGKDFFHSLNDKSPAATKFKDQVLLLHKLYSDDFYRAKDCGVILDKFLGTGINMITSAKIRLEFLRGMHQIASIPGNYIPGISAKIKQSIGTIHREILTTASTRSHVAAIGRITGNVPKMTRTNIKGK